MALNTMGRAPGPNDPLAFDHNELSSFEDLAAASLAAAPAQEEEVQVGGMSYTDVADMFRYSDMELSELSPMGLSGLSPMRL